MSWNRQLSQSKILPVYLDTPCNPEVCPASSSSERTAGPDDPFTTNIMREIKLDTVYGRVSDFKNICWQNLPKLPPGGAQRQVDWQTLSEGKSACCPKGTVSHWLQWDAPPSQKAPVPPLHNKHGTTYEYDVLYASPVCTSHLLLLTSVLFSLHLSVSTSHHQTGTGGQHTFWGSSRCSAAASSDHFQKPLKAESHEKWVYDDLGIRKVHSAKL